MEVIIPIDTNTDEITVTEEAGDLKKRELDLMYPSCDFYQNGISSLKVYDPDATYNLGDVVCDDDGGFHPTTATNIRRLILKTSSGKEFWESITDFDSVNNSSLLGTATMWSPYTWYEADSFVYEEKTDVDSNHIFNVYRIKHSGFAHNSSNMQYLHNFTLTQTEYDSIGIGIIDFVYVLADSYPVWDTTTDFKAGDLVYVGVRVSAGFINYFTPRGSVYKAISDNTNVNPIEASLYWEKQPYVDWFAQFDKVVNTNYKMFNCDIKSTFYNINNIDAVVAINPDMDKIEFTWYLGLPPSYTSIQTDEQIVSVPDGSDFATYGFNEWEKRSYCISRRPFVAQDGQVDIIYKGSSKSVGALIAGKSFYIGKTLFGYEKRNRSFTKITTTDEGKDYITKGKTTKSITAKVLIENSNLDTVFDSLQSLDGTLCLWLLEDENWVYGYYKDLYVTKNNPSVSECNLQIIGVL